MNDTVYNNDFINHLNQLKYHHSEDDKYTLDNLCKNCNLSRSQLHRKVKDETGISVSIYIRKIRLNKVIELLRDTDSNISEISYLSGFASSQCLSKN